jgi:hypothetical protein
MEGRSLRRFGLVSSAAMSGVGGRQFSWARRRGLPLRSLRRKTRGFRVSGLISQATLRHQALTSLALRSQAAISRQVPPGTAPPGIWRRSAPAQRIGEIKPESARARTGGVPLTRVSAGRNALPAAGVSHGGYLTSFVTWSRECAGLSRRSETCSRGGMAECLAAAVVRAQGENRNRKLFGSK